MPTFLLNNGSIIILHLEGKKLDEKIYSVSEVTRYIESLINDDPYLTDINVVGEVVDLKERSGHLFFTLKDEEASISCVFFGGVYRSKILEGSLVKVYGDVRVYAQKGFYRLICKEVRTLTKAGNMFLKLRQTYEKLLKEGIFEKPKKPFPKFPSKIGIITSRDSAAYQDILRTARERFPAVKIILFHTKVQGEDAKESLLKALEDANKENLDAVIIARGGGASDDLWVFNDEEIVRAVFKLRHPVVTGIGHQIDTVLVDFVADYSAHTPTAAAEYLLPSKSEIISEASKNLERLKKTVENLINTKFALAKSASQNLRKIARFKVISEIDKAKLTMTKLYSKANLILEKYEATLKVLGAKLSMLDPLLPLTKGYSIVSKDGKWVKSIRDVGVGEILMIKFFDGTVKVMVYENRRDVERASDDR
ncbi:exodeoxyribonuclease VII large subunit [Pseudothermotoga thermarum]|uniref:Exodeoxyribonuclease 7 large subunit n=1 Tax=Pseudothermotoga thermarum DSM 5069 TaxID=688269 RepID=F7YWP1_9THEM|nr:exodeoxyribonuclease VII large subunit [Pseudothermotoga thermarum]AEH52031.1 exodeoxyribonuclease VII, large subunit [Pseudothermotoga thermarum DSM 5069]